MLLQDLGDARQQRRAGVARADRARRAGGERVLLADALLHVVDVEVVDGLRGGQHRDGQLLGDARVLCDGLEEAGDARHRAQDQCVLGRARRDRAPVLGHLRGDAGRGEEVDEARRVLALRFVDDRGDDQLARLCEVHDGLLLLGVLDEDAELGGRSLRAGLHLVDGRGEGVAHRGVDRARRLYDEAVEAVGVGGRDGVGGLLAAVVRLELGPAACLGGASLGLRPRGL